MDAIRGPAIAGASGRHARSLAVRDAALAVAPPLLFLALLLLLWEGAVAVFQPEPYLFPAPSRVARAFGELRSVLPGHIRTTGVEAVIGLAAGAASGVVIALVLAASDLVRRLLYPLLVTSQTVPMVVLAPLLITWFGFGLAPKVVVVALVAFFPVAVSTTAGLLGADRELIDLVRSMGGRGATISRFVRFPAAVPHFLAGLKVAAAYSVASAVVGEWVGAESGLGILITRSNASYRVDRVFAAIVVIAALSIVLFALVHAMARLIAPWTYVENQQEKKA